MPSRRESSHWWPDLPVISLQLMQSFLHCNLDLLLLPLSSLPFSILVRVLHIMTNNSKSWPQSWRCWPRFQQSAPLPSAPCAESLEACSRERARVVATLEERIQLIFLLPSQSRVFCTAASIFSLSPSSSYPSATLRSECCA